MKLTSIYSKLPVCLQNACVSAYGFLRERRRYGGNFKEHYKSVLLTEFANDKEVYILQKEKLHNLLVTASTARYYKRLFSDIGVDVVEEDPFEIFKKMPILSKESLRGNEKDFFTDKVAGALDFHTSGSTGTPLNVKMSKSDHRLRMALLERQKNRFGVSHKSRHLTFVGKKITDPKKKTFWRYNIFGNQMVMSVYDLSDGNKEKYLNAIVKYSPEVVEGYPSALTVVASWLRDGDVRLPVKCVFATAETITSEQRQIIEAGFGAPVVGYYGSTEGATMITQCEYGKMHIDNESGMIEFVDDAGMPSKSGEMSRMLITSFTTEAMPLIRYDICDMAIWSDEICSCGRCGLVVSEIVGRVDDVFITREKGNVGRLSTSLKLLPSFVRRAQIHQYSLDDFELMLESDECLSELELKVVCDDLCDKLGNVNITVSYTPKIPEGKNGKFRTQINHCK